MRIKVMAVALCLSLVIHASNAVLAATVTSTGISQPSGARSLLFLDQTLNLPSQWQHLTYMKGRVAALQVSLLHWIPQRPGDISINSQDVDQTLVFHYSLWGLLTDLTQIALAPYVFIRLFEILTQIRLKNRAPAETLLPIPVKVLWGALLFYVPMSLVHEMSHLLAAHAVIDSFIGFVRMDALMSGVNQTVPTYFASSWWTDLGLSETSADILFKLGGQIGSTLYLGLLWIGEKIFSRFSFWTRSLQLATLLISMRLLIQEVGMFFGVEAYGAGGSDFGYVAQLLGPSAVWGMPLLYLAAAFPPIYVLRELLSRYSKPEAPEKKSQITKANYPAAAIVPAKWVLSQA